MSGTVILDVQALGVRLGPAFAVHVDRLVLRQGKVLVLDAPSGAGKSTVLGLVSGAINPSPEAARIHTIGEQAVGPDIPRLEYAGPQAVGYVLQTNVMIPYLSVIENIDLPMRVAGTAPDPAWRAHLLRTLGLEGLEDRMANQISVGQRQRASIARALAGQPGLLLLDEPVAALDPGNAEQVEMLIAILAEEAGAAVLLASHQAMRGAFRDAPRAGHAVRTAGGVTSSVFGCAVARDAAA